MVTLEMLKGHLRYEPNSGKFYWLKPTTKRVSIGAEAGTLDGMGYVQIGIFGKRYKAHRLAWAFENNTWSEYDIDHINGNGLDNRISNLREASKSQNAFNSKLSKANTSGIKGISVINGKYRARVKCGDKAHEMTFSLTETGKAEAESWLKAIRVRLHGHYARNT